MKSQRENLRILLSLVDSRDGKSICYCLRAAIELLVHKPQFFPQQQEQQLKLFS